MGKRTGTASGCAYDESRYQRCAYRCCERSISGSDGRMVMKAVLLMNHGGPEMLHYGDAPDPVAGPGEAVVDIHAASVNGADYKVRVGHGRYKLNHFPHILGRDFSGLVSQVGAGVTDFKVGVAGFGVQLAKHLGATVITTASAGNHAYVRSLGADRVIDYNRQDFTTIGPICDVVFDTVGGNVRAGCYAVL